MFAIRRIKIILLSIFIIYNVTISQNQFYFDGYLLNLSLVQLRKNPFTIHSNNIFQNLERIRLRPSLNFDDRFNFTVEYEAFIHYKNKIETYSENYKIITGQIVNLHSEMLNNRLWHIIHFIDRMYLKINFDKINLTLGRQRIAWGTGRIWNPTDLFNPINPTNFAKIEKDGVDAAFVKYNFANLTDLSIVINPTKIKTNFSIRLRTNFSEFDLSVLGGKFTNDYVLGADFAGNLLNAGVRGEMLYSQNNIKYILGIDHQFTPKIYSLIEYHFNGAGKSKKAFYDFNSLLNNYSIYLAKKYFIFQLSYIVHPLSSISILIKRNLNDNSSFYSLDLSYSILDNLNVSWITNVFSGSCYTEYWYYPSSTIIRSEYYF